MSGQCKQCGAKLAPDAPEGLCPGCLLKRGLDTQTADLSGGSQPDADFVPPSPDELAPYFPGLEILAFIRRGGMGLVYKARHKRLDRVVALKILLPRIADDEAFAERFVREARAMAMLSHPNIVTLYDFAQATWPFGRKGNSAEAGPTAARQETPVYYFLMEYVDGLTLRELLDAGKLAPREALAIVPQICEALQYAHDHGVVHRDIKPGNILLDKHGQVKITDFGLAKMMGQAPADFTLTETGQVMGTPHYMAPEQVEHPQEVDHRADIYSLGVVFYQMLTGDLPMGHFAAPSKKVAIDVRLDEVVLRSLEREPELRYQHARDVKTEVETIAGQKKPHLAPAGANLRYEYRSKTTIGEWPLVHIAIGGDPYTGRPRHARGIVAIGDRATGVIACGGLANGIVAVGGLAMGAFAFGGLGIGLFSLGGVALGLLALGGAAVGLLFAFGGGAMGMIATGGAALGYYSEGAVAVGAHTLSLESRDSAAIDLFQRLPSNATLVTILFVLVVAVMIVQTVAWVVLWWKTRARQALGAIVGSIVGLSALVPGIWGARSGASNLDDLRHRPSAAEVAVGAGNLGANKSVQLNAEGWRLWQQGRMFEALPKFEEAVKLDPRNEAAWNGLGWTTFNVGNRREAEAAFRRVIDLQPRAPGAFNGLGQLYLIEGKYDQAEPWLLKAAPDAEAAWWGLTKLYLLQGKFAEAEKWAKKIVDASQANPAVRDDARRFLEAAKAKRLSPDLREMIEPAPIKP